MKDNKSKRLKSEGYGIFGNPSVAREAWRSIGQAILQNPAAKPIPMYDKDGQQTLASSVEQMSYEQLMRSVKDIQTGQSRAPTELEMIMGCQIHRARYDTQAAIFVRDTMGAKPIDESKAAVTVQNEYEHLTDEELEELAAIRASKQGKDGVKEIVDEAKAESKGDVPV